MMKVLNVDEQTARDTAANLIRNKDRLTVNPVRDSQKLPLRRRQY